MKKRTKKPTALPKLIVPPVAIKVSGVPGLMNGTNYVDVSFEVGAQTPTELASKLRILASAIASMNGIGGGLAVIGLRVAR